MQTYELADALCVYKTEQDRFYVMKGERGETCSFAFTDEMLAILDRLRAPASLDDLHKAIPGLPLQTLRATLRDLIGIDIVHETNEHLRTVDCAILGVGSIGSHIFTQLSQLPIHSLTIIDDDVVEADNTNRQCFTQAEIGVPKVQALAARHTAVGNIRALQCRVSSADDMARIAVEGNCNLLVQAADYPSAGETAHYIWQAADSINVPYITIPGYIGGSIGFSEFYYPRETYNHGFNRHPITHELLFQHTLGKIPYRMCSILGSLVAQQVDDYRHHLVPIGYGERGHFDSSRWEWDTEREVPRPDTEPETWERQRTINSNAGYVGNGEVN